MPKKDEKNLLNILYIKIKEKQREFYAEDFLIILFGNYLDLPSENHFFLINKLLCQLKNVPKQTNNKNDIVAIVREINTIPEQQLLNSKELSLRLKIFFQFYPEFIQYLTSGHSDLLKIIPAFFLGDKKSEPVKEVKADNLDNSLLNLSPVEREAYLLALKDHKPYINFLKQLSFEERGQNISKLILDVYIYPDKIHIFNMNVLRHFIEDVPASLLSKLLTYTLWVIQNKLPYNISSTLSILGKLHQRGLDITLSEKDRNGPFNESKILGVVYYLFCNDELPLTDRAEIFDDIIDLLPNSLNLMYEVFTSRNGAMFESQVELFLSKIILASEEQKSALFKSTIRNTECFSESPYLLISTIFDNCSSETKLHLKNFLLNPITMKDPHHNTRKLINYIKLFIIKDDCRETFEGLIKLLYDCSHNEYFINCILNKINTIMPMLTENDYVSIANVCIPLLDNFRTNWNDQPCIAKTLKSLMTYSKEIEKNIIAQALNVLKKTVIEEKDEVFLHQFFKFSIIFSGKVNFINDDFSHAISLRLYHIIKNNITSYHQITSGVGDGELRESVDIEMLNKAQAIVTHLNNFISPSIFSLIGEQLYLYLEDNFDYNKIHAIKFIADNFFYFQTELRDRFFTLLLPRINVTDKAGQFAERYFKSNFVEYTDQAIKIGCKLLEAFSRNTDGSLNVKNIILILIDLVNSHIPVMISYLNQFSDPAQDYIEKYVMLQINSNTEVVKPEITNEISRRQYLRYYRFATKAMVSEVFNNINGNNLAGLVTGYVEDHYQSSIVPQY